MDSGRHTQRRRKLGAFLVLIGLLGTLFGTVGLSPATADGGDFSLDFVAAGPGDYDHTTGDGGAFDDRTIDKDTGVVESLEGGDFACGDIVVFFTEITVDAGATGAQDIELDMSWLAEPTGQPGAGFVDLLSAAANTVANGAEADGDSGHITDGDEAVAIVSETFDTSGPKDAVLATISVSNLEAGESFILRTEVLLGCEIGSSPTGNIQADILAARVTSPTADVISVGNQTIPLKKVEDIAEPSFTITKVASADTVNSGDTLSFTITVTNTGNVPLEDVVLTDPLPGAGFTWEENPDLLECSITGSTLTCNFGDIPVGGSESVTVRATAVTGVCGLLDNTATATTTNAGSQQASDSITILCPAIDIDKLASDGIDADSTASDDETFEAGDVIGFDITVTNGGPGIATDVVVSDTLPDLPSGADWSIVPPVTGCSLSGDDNRILSCTFTTLAAGATVTIHVQATTAAADCLDADNSISYPNTASVTTGNNGSDEDSAAVTVNCAAIDIDKQASDGIDADSAASDSESFIAGAVVGFDIVVTNTGIATAKNVVVSDTLPDLPSGADWSIVPPVTGCSLSGDDNRSLSCTFTTLAAGASVTIHVQATSTAADCGAYPNTASVTTGNDGSDEDSASLTVLCPDVGVTKVAEADPINAGDTARFTITAQNFGDGATTVTLNDPLPAGISWEIVSQSEDMGCSITAGTLACSFSLAANDGAPGGADEKSVVISGVTDAADCGLLTNLVTVSAAGDINPANNEASDTITVLCPDLDITKVADDDTVSAGEEIGFTITVSNDGPGVAFGVTLDDPLPAGVTWEIDSQTEGANCEIVADVLSCGPVDLGVGESFSVHVLAITTEADCAVYENTATADASNDDPVTATDDTTVQCPVIDVTKVADDDLVSAGEDIGFTITVSNAGPGTAFDVTLNDPLPGGDGIFWAIVGDTGAATCQITGDAGSQVLSCDVAEMAPGDSFSVHVVSETQPSGEECQSATLENTATADASNDAPVVADDTINIQCPGVNLFKTADDDVVDAGEAIGFAITLSNAGPGDAFDVTISDVLPAGVDWVIDSQLLDGVDVNACDVVLGTLLCSLDELPAGSALVVHVSADTTEADCAVYDNTATATVDNGADPDDASDSSEVLCPIEIDLDKTGDALAHVGDTVTYEFTVTNVGGEDLVNVTLTDPDCDAGTITLVDDGDGDDVLAAGTWDGDSFEGGEVWTYTCTRLLTVDDIVIVDGEDFAINLGAVTAEDDTGRDTSDEDDHVVEIINPAIQVVKSVNDATPDIGQTVTFTYVVTNTGDTTLFDILVVDDKLGTIGTIAELAPGESATLTKTMVVAANSPTVNIATATGSDVLGKEVSDDEPETITINPPQVLGVTLPKTGAETRLLLVTASGLILLGGLLLLSTSRPAMARSSRRR